MSGVLNLEDAEKIENEMRRLEDDPSVTKRELRLFMQSLMPCSHAVTNLLTCSDPPYGCVECLHEMSVTSLIARQQAALDVAEKALKYVHFPSPTGMGYYVSEAVYAELQHALAAIREAREAREGKEKGVDKDAE